MTDETIETLQNAYELLQKAEVQISVEIRNEKVIDLTIFKGIRLGYLRASIELLRRSF